MKKLLCLTVLMILAGCLACSHTGGFSQPASYKFLVEIPEGWRLIDHNRYFMVTKENPFQQYIMVQNRPIGKSFRHTKKTMGKTMLPEEAAQIIVDELVSDQNLVNLRILDNSPATINGHNGFKLLYSYRDAKGQTYKTLYYGFIKEDTFFNLRFRAADQVYFQRDIGAFRFVMNSFEILRADAS